jgi:hypothetical protein
MPEGTPRLIDAPETMSLSGWIDQRGGIDDVFAALLTHPRLTEAIRAFAIGSETAPAATAPLDGRLKDVGCYVIAMCAFYLHQTGDVTLPRLKEMAAARTLMSVGRARSLLTFLCYLGYLNEVPSERGGTSTRYVATERFEAAWLNHLSALLSVTAILEPSVVPVRDQLHDPAVFAAFCRHHAEIGFREVRESHQSTGFVRVFLHRYAGSQILWQLYLAEKADTAAPHAAIPVSINAIAHRHGVSRTHVRRLLDAGVAEGLLRFVCDREVVLEDAGRAAVRFFQATQFFVFITAAKRVMAELTPVR